VFTYVYSRYALCLLLQILLVAALDLKSRDVPTVSSINSLMSQYLKVSHCLSNFYVEGRQLFALPRLSHGQRPALVGTCCASEWTVGGWMYSIVGIYVYTLLPSDDGLLASPKHVEV
jgi:hypothetical protein